MQQIFQGEPVAARRRIYFRMVDSGDGKTAETGLTFADSDIKVSKAGGAEADFDGSTTELAGGMYYYECDTGEIDTLGPVYIRVVKSGALDFVGVAQIIEDTPRGAVVTDGSNSATSFKTDLASAVNDYYKDALCLITSGDLVDQIKRVTGYNGTTKFLTVSGGFTGTPADAVTFRLLNR